MYSTSYSILKDEDRDVIVHVETGLRVNVFGLEADNFIPANVELHIYGDYHGELLAFETENWSVENFDVLKGAAIWYARYLEVPEMDITDDDPRPKFKLRKL